MQVECGNCSVMQLKSGKLGTEGCLAAALLEGPGRGCGVRSAVLGRATHSHVMEPLPSRQRVFTERETRVHRERNACSARDSERASERESGRERTDRQRDRERQRPKQVVADTANAQAHRRLCVRQTCRGGAGRSVPRCQRSVPPADSPVSGPTTPRVSADSAQTKHAPSYRGGLGCGFRVEGVPADLAQRREERDACALRVQRQRAQRVQPAPPCTALSQYQRA
eukprot:3215949-Rhodomonas_salina.1